MLPRELPDSVPPARHELIASYLDRLGALHGVAANHLWRLIAPSTAADPGGLRVVPERLAALTGRSVHDLAGALPELRDPQPDWAMFRHLPQAGCHRCDARHPGGRVARILPHHRYACTRHDVWIGPLDIDRPADVRAIPEITKAQDRHLRIVRKFGWNAAHDGLLTAFVFCGHLWSGLERTSNVERRIRQVWEARTDLLISPDNTFASYSTSKLFAVVYPEAVSIAPLLASPYWRNAAGGTDAERFRFHSELIERIGYLSESDHAVESLDRWATTRAPHPPARPTMTYAPGRKRVTAADRTLHRGRRHEKSAYWFGRKRQAGMTILWHNHIKPAYMMGWIHPAPATPPETTSTSPSRNAGLLRTNQ